MHFRLRPCAHPLARKAAAPYRAVFIGEESLKSRVEGVDRSTGDVRLVEDTNGLSSFAVDVVITGGVTGVADETRGSPHPLRSGIASRRGNVTDVVTFICAFSLGRRRSLVVRCARG